MLPCLATLRPPGSPTHVCKRWRKHDSHECKCGFTWKTLKDKITLDLS